MENSVHYVFRRKILLENYELIYKRKIFFTNKNFYSFLRDGANFISGKIKKLNLLTFLHQYHYQSNIKTFLNHEQMINDNLFISDFRKFYNKILKIFFKKEKKKLKYIMFNNKFFFPKTKSKSINLIESKKKFKLKDLIFKKLSKIKIILLFYSFFLNINMHLVNKHISKFMISIKNNDLKKELNYIFNFLKKNHL